MAETQKRSGPPAGARRFNTFAVKLAGRRYFPPWALVRHVGRTSGRSYSTPVAPLTRKSDVIIIGLPWGEKTDWVRNIQAAGGCTVEWKGTSIPVSQPTFVDKEVAFAAANRVQRFALGRKTPASFLQLRRS